MKKDILITIDTTTSLVKSNSAVAGVKSENLQGNLIIKPEPFIDGTGRLYINNQGSIEMIKKDDCYILPIQSSLLKNGDFNYCFKITEPETEKGIPVFCSEISDMEVADSITDETEIPEQYPTWAETFDSKIAEIEKLEQTVFKNEKARDNKVNTAVQNIKDLTADYNENAQKKTDEFNENASKKEKTYNDNAEVKEKNYNDLAEEKEAELNTIAEVVEDMASALQHSTFKVDSNMHLKQYQAKKMKNTRFSLNNGHLGVKVIL